jgi:uncharacterized protein (DUF2147 family)
MKKLILSISSLLIAATSWADSDLNSTKWKTIDDSSGKPVFIIEMNKIADKTYNGKIVEVFNPLNKNSCETCKGSYKNKNLIGAVVINNLKHIEGNKFGDGKIVDPESGNTYSLQGELKDNGKMLHMRGFLGISLLGRNQNWIRVN